MSEDQATQSRQTVPPPTAPQQPPQGGVIRQWTRESLFKKVSLATRGMAFLCSLISFIIMVSNKQGGFRYDEYETFRYVLAISISSTIYTAMQLIRQGYEMNTGKEMFQLRLTTLLWIDFSGDQIFSYLLLSAASSAAPIINALRQYINNLGLNKTDLFMDSLAASISMAFLAFFSLAVSALLSGYKLSSTL